MSIRLIIVFLVYTRIQTVIMVQTQTLPVDSNRNRESNLHQFRSREPHLDIQVRRHTIGFRLLSRWVTAWTSRGLDSRWTQA